MIREKQTNPERPIKPGDKPQAAHEAENLAKILRGGGVVALPTDTFYALAACGTNEDAVRRVFAIKSRPATTAVPLLIAEPADVPKYAAELTGAQQRVVTALGQRFWPGPLSIVLTKAPIVPSIVSAGKDTVALRVPDSPLVREVARLLGAPLTGTSANRSGENPATTSAAVRDAFGDAVDAVADGGTTPGGPPSTVVDLTSPAPRILRAGAISLEEISEAIHDAHSN
jgi:L-threonylcarbamoyladenylate synthase